MDLDGIIAGSLKELLKSSLSKKAGHTSNIEQTQQKLIDTYLSSKQLNSNLLQIYSADGRLQQIGQFQIKQAIDKAALFKKLGKSISLKTADLAPQLADGQNVDSIMISILQESFALIKFEIKKEEIRSSKQVKKEGKEEADKEKSEQDEQKESEEQQESLKKAKDLLDALLLHAENTNDLKEYCHWARESAKMTKEQIMKFYSPLDPQTERCFDILNDAILALENGVSINQIKQQLNNAVR